MPWQPPCLLDLGERRPLRPRRGRARLAGTRESARRCCAPPAQRCRGSMPGSSHRRGGAAGQAPLRLRCVALLSEPREDYPRRPRRFLCCDRLAAAALAGGSPADEVCLCRPCVSVRRHRVCFKFAGDRVSRQCFRGKLETPSSATGLSPAQARTGTLVGNAGRPSFCSSAASP